MGILKVSTLSVYLFMVQVFSVSECTPKKLNHMSGNLTAYHVVLQSGGKCTVNEIAVYLGISGPVPVFQLHELGGCADRLTEG